MNDNTHEYLKSQLVTGESITKKDAFVAFVKTPEENELVARARRSLKKDGITVGGLLISADSEPWSNVPGSLHGSWEVSAQVDLEPENASGVEDDFEVLTVHLSTGEIYVSFGKYSTENSRIDGHEIRRISHSNWIEAKLDDLSTERLLQLKSKFEAKKHQDPLLLQKAELTETFFQFI